VPYAHKGRVTESFPPCGRRAGRDWCWNSTGLCCRVLIDRRVFCCKETVGRNWSFNFAQQFFYRFIEVTEVLFFLALPPVSVVPKVPVDMVPAGIRGAAGRPGTAELSA